jgi:hypothetical protein
LKENREEWQKLVDIDVRAALSKEEEAKKKEQEEAKKKEQEEAKKEQEEAKKEQGIRLLDHTREDV